MHNARSWSTNHLILYPFCHLCYVCLVLFTFSEVSHTTLACCVHVHGSLSDCASLSNGDELSIKPLTACLIVCVIVVVWQVKGLVEEQGSDVATGFAAVAEQVRSFYRDGVYVVPLPYRAFVGFPG